MRQKRRFVPSEIWGDTWGAECGGVSKRFVYGMVEGNHVSEHHEAGKRAKAIVLRIERVVRALCR